jgi:hypothetical protein
LIVGNHDGSIVGKIVDNIVGNNDDNRDEEMSTKLSDNLLILKYCLTHDQPVREKNHALSHLENSECIGAAF